MSEVRRRLSFSLTCSTSSTGDPIKDKDARDKVVGELKQASTDLANAKKAFREAQEKSKTEGLKSATNDSISTTVGDKGYIAQQIKETNATIIKYESVSSTVTPDSFVRSPGKVHLAGSFSLVSGTAPARDGQRGQLGSVENKKVDVATAVEWHFGPCGGATVFHKTSLEESAFGSIQVILGQRRNADRQRG